MTAIPKPPKRGPKPKKRIRTRRPLGTVRSEAKAAGGVDPDTWQAILRHYGFRCCRCFAAWWQEQGHGKALSRGGTHSADNVFPLCKACNQRQGTRTWFPRRRHPWMAGESEDTR